MNSKTDFKLMLPGIKENKTNLVVVCYPKGLGVSIQYTSPLLCEEDTALWNHRPVCTI